METMKDAEGQGYNANLISTIVDISDSTLTSIIGYNANLISTIVDTITAVQIITGYNANLISTIVDSSSGSIFTVWL